MSIDTLSGKHVNAKLWIPISEVEYGALDQIRNVCAIPGVIGVAVMPDCHVGSGATIGSVIKTKDIICPSLTGVDIGCGMCAVRTSFTGKQLKRRDLEAIHEGIRQRIPVGFNFHQSVNKRVKDMHIWNGMDGLPTDLLSLKDRAMAQMGTLGGGNHFIELSTDQNDDVWIVLHSGSRHIGLQIANWHIKIAKGLEYNKSGLPDKALAYFKRGTLEFDNYMYDLRWAQEYARLNRERMMTLIKGMLDSMYPIVEFMQEIECHHNCIEIVQVYDAAEDMWVDKEYVTRKGAISAQKDQWGIIPGAMGAKSYIVRGLGNEEAMYSAPHGAGRRMSRSKAKKNFDLADLEFTMKGIVCSVSKSTVDEIKHSYKDIDTVMNYSSDLVEPVYELTQLLNIKG